MPLGLADLVCIAPLLAWSWATIASAITSKLLEEQKDRQVRVEFDFIRFTSLITVMMKSLKDTFINSAHNIDKKEDYCNSTDYLFLQCAQWVLNPAISGQIISNTWRRLHFHCAGFMGIGSNPACPWQEIANDCINPQNTCQYYLKTEKSRTTPWILLVNNCSVKQVPLGASTWSLNLPLNRRASALQL